MRGHEEGKPFVPVLFDVSHAEFQKRQPEWVIRSLPERRRTERDSEMTDRAVLVKRLCQKGVIAIVRAYQWLLSPLLGDTCRFHPSCSQYCIDAIRKYGPAKGGIKSLLRILRCHPFHPGGVDYP